MAIHNALLVASFILSAIIWSSVCEELPPTTDPDDEASTDPITYLSPEKRQQHSIMRFGKRPAGNGHQLIHFGKRFDGKSPKHSYLFFGKRSPDSSESKLPEILEYLQRRQESSWKRGHNIMRFGKRGNHNILRFGKRDGMMPDEYEGPFDDSAEYLDDGDIEDAKRTGHAMMYFGKRAGHSMMYFGKRGGHSMVHFGKRDYSNDYPDSEDLSEAKRGPHSMIHFGKRDDYESDDLGEKRAHSMIHFGKRLFGDLTDNDDEKRAHAMIHFGKRDDDEEDDSEMGPDEFPGEDKRGQHSMIHFGKRSEEDRDVDDIARWNAPNGPLGAGTKRYHSLMRFGKRPKGSHAMIHFGKREDFDKRAHSMIHFGKRSVAEDIEKDQVTINSSSSKNENKDKTSQGDSQYLKRQKRQAVVPENPVVTFVHYLPEDLQDPNDGPFDEYDESYAENLIRPMSYQGEENAPLILPKPVDIGEISRYSDPQTPQKKQNSKNVFLRFGKR